MRKWQSYYEVLYFPLVLLFTACVIRGISGLVLNTAFQTTFRITNKYVILCAEMFNYLGYYLTIFFPFLVLIKFLSKKFEDSVPVFIGVVGYIIFHVANMFFAPSTLPATSYGPEFGISVDASNLTLPGTGIRYPLATGFVAVIVVYYLTKCFYRSSRRTSNVGVFAFVNRDSIALITTGIACLLAGVLFGVVWKYVAKGLYYIFDFIADDITNPINLFIYGILERVLAVFDLDSIIHSAFWFGERGGSWVSNGVIYLGDVSIWTAQLQQGVFGTGFGRFLTPYYIQNLFIVPSIIIVTFTTFTDKIERSKFTIFLVLAVITSVLCGTLLPIEIYLLIMTPLFYGFHVFMSGVLYAVLQASKVWIGYSYTGTLNMATPGTIYDLLIHARAGNIGMMIVQMVIIGLVFAGIYALVLFYYYYYGCIDILQTGKQREVVDGFIKSVGGIENIKTIYSTPTKIILQVDDASLLNFKMMQEQGAYKVVETRTTYDISFGAISCLLARDVNRLRKYKSVSN